VCAALRPARPPPTTVTYCPSISLSQYLAGLAKVRASATKRVTRQGKRMDGIEIRTNASERVSASVSETSGS
jgi:hypothetical protein